MSFTRMLMLLVALGAVASCAYPTSAPETKSVAEIRTDNASLPSEGEEAIEPPKSADIRLALRPPPRKPQFLPNRDEETATLLNPENLVGFGESQMSEFLGEPQTIRKEGAATVWHYAVDECWMDLFFYADLATGERRVLSYRIDPQSEEDAESMKERCIERIRLVSRKGG